SSFSMSSRALLTFSFASAKPWAYASSAQSSVFEYPEHAPCSVLADTGAAAGSTVAVSAAESRTRLILISRGRLGLEVGRWRACRMMHRANQLIVRTLAAWLA